MNENVHKHKWIVFSTGLLYQSLMVTCDCLAYGTVDDPTQEEWNEAYHAPSSPYEWTGGDNRVREEKESSQ